ncbi:HCP-like protein [Cystobasidium minutum MCA 4210]|uniref:HCP-like protein n=1 Tax=Cystobasidium minutum MCA 4210 TaxID=1397322 RepID=UPI0034CEB8C6|eukprot:jgi/Rhomi1/145755/e_gw1.5.495.1
MHNPYFPQAQQQQQYDPQGQLPYDPNAGYYPQNDQYAYDQYAYDQNAPPQQYYNAQAPQYAGSSSGGYSAYPQQAVQPQNYGAEYSTEPPRAPSGSFSQGIPANYAPLNRNKTTVSAKSSLSVDRSQSTQPITKQAVDDYRNRIKSDPDPETQFNFARFLIEAARRLAVAAQQGSVDDAKSVKKYRDALLQEAIKLIKRLATQGSGLGKPAYADAQFFLANCLGHGALGLSVDHEKAYNLYVQASKQNHPAATYRTAVCNEVGAGTRREPSRAVLFYRKASALGDTAGMYKLGMILLNGLLGQQKNPREAVIWLKKAAAQADEENPHALHELGVLYEKPVEYMQNGQPVPSPVVRDEALARDFYTQAAQLGHAPSQCKLGACYEYGNLTCPVDPRRSIAWYTRAAEKGHAESELALSGWYLSTVLKPSDSEAYLWARRAANKGLSKAEYAVGYYSEVGIGVKADLEEAKMWYLRAAASGNRRAMQRLSELKKMGNRKAQQGARPTRQQAEKECIIM